MVVYEGLLAETIRFAAHNGDEIPAYFARPLGSSSVPGVVDRLEGAEANATAAGFPLQAVFTRADLGV